MPFNAMFSIKMWLMITHLYVKHSLYKTFDMYLEIRLYRYLGIVEEEDGEFIFSVHIYIHVKFAYLMFAHNV